MKLILSLIILTLLLGPIHKIQLYSEDESFSSDKNVCNISKYTIEYLLRRTEQQALVENNTYILKLVKCIADYLLNTNLSCKELVIVKNIIENMHSLLALNISTKAYNVVVRGVETSTTNKTLEEVYYTILDENKLSSIIGKSSSYTMVTNGYSNTTTRPYISNVSTLYTPYSRSFFKAYYPFKTSNATRAENIYSYSPYMLLFSFLSLAIIIILTVALFKPKIRI